MYKKAGIEDIADFYKRKFAVPAKWDFTDNVLNFLDISYFKMLWIFSRVTEGARVLDFGCGSGALSCLKRKNCHITGVDLSPDALEIARSYNSYDSVYCGDIFSFPHERHSFDYVVSMDVFGHIPFEEKDAVIQRLKELLKPGGIMLHGIECGNWDYDAMSPEQLKQFVSVDGHVGVEGKHENINRFKKFFTHVKGEARYDVVNSAEEYLRQAEHYRIPINQTLIMFLKTLSDFERKIFNIASGFTLINMENKNVPSSDEVGEFLFLEASDNPLPIRKIEIPDISRKVDINSLMRDENVFLKGWYGIEKGIGGSFRWSKNKAFLCLPGFKGSQLHLSLFTLHPNVSEKHVDVFFRDGTSKKVIMKITLNSTRSYHVSIPVNSDDFILEIFVDTTFIPSLVLPGSADERELGIGVDKIQVSFPSDPYQESPVKSGLGEDQSQAVIPEKRNLHHLNQFLKNFYRAQTAKGGWKASILHYLRGHLLRN
jgi:SAM-dependent methyltransferase